VEELTDEQQAAILDEVERKEGSTLAALPALRRSATCQSVLDAHDPASRAGLEGERLPS
jgi:hypothetical protein